MNPVLQDKLNELESSADYECWYLVKQPAKFESICYLVSFLKEYQANSGGKSLSDFINSKIDELNLPENRGNAPAIFGEVFQLLDRMLEPKTINGITYRAGTSEYDITNRYMGLEIYGDGSRKVRIPSNLSIIGTMNTSDQNVFTLDTAFQRRWNMRLIENSFQNVRPTLANAQILDTGVSWQHFCETINRLILDNKNKLASAEDKRLGVYFVHENDLRYDTSDNHKQNRKFAEKVIKYLWDDAFKFNAQDLKCARPFV